MQEDFKSKLSKFSGAKRLKKWSDHRIIQFKATFHICLLKINSFILYHGVNSLTLCHRKNIFTRN